VGAGVKRRLAQLATAALLVGGAAVTVAAPASAGAGHVCGPATYGATLSTPLGLIQCLAFETDYGEELYMWVFV
jgi:hypothetical protein